MSSGGKNILGNNPLEGVPSAEGFKIHVVVSDWNDHITYSLRDGAISVLERKGIPRDQIKVVNVPGAFELPVAAKMLMANYPTDGVICLGCVIKGETEHDHYINLSVANSLNQLAILSGKPVTFGLLTVNDEQQALDRSGGKHGNKGEEAAITAITMVSLNKGLSKNDKKIGF